MLVEGVANGLSGAFSVLGGALGGYSGFHNTVFTKLLSKKWDLTYRFLVENIFTLPFKLGISFLKQPFLS